jgi:hypothetical protein
MADHRLVEAYLIELARHLPGDANHRSRVLDEVRDHLLAVIARELTRGASEEQAVERALAQFGSPRTIGLQFVALDHLQEQGSVLTDTASKILGCLAFAASAYYAWFFVAVRPAQGALVGAIILAVSGLVALFVRPPAVGHVQWFRDGRPASVGGWLCAGLALVVLVAIFVSVDRGSHSVSDTLIGSIPLLTPVAVLALLVVRALDRTGPATD